MHNSEHMLLATMTHRLISAITAHFNVRPTMDAPLANRIKAARAAIEQADATGEDRVVRPLLAELVLSVGSIDDTRINTCVLEAKALLQETPHTSERGDTDTNNANAYWGIAGEPVSWQNSSDEALKGVVRTFFSSQVLTTPQLERLRAYCLYVIQAPCYYESQAEKERLSLEEKLKKVQTADALKKWLHEAVQFGIDPF